MTDAIRPRSRTAADGGWLTIHEASALVGVSVATLRRWCDSGTVRAFTTPGGHRRFDRAAVLGLLPPVPDGVPSLVGAETHRSIMRAYRRELRATAVWPRSIEVLDECAREPFRACGRRMVAAVVACLDGAAATERARAQTAADLAAADYGRVAAAHGVPIGEAVGVFLRFRSPFLHELGALARRRALDATDATLLLEAASDTLDGLLPAVVAGHEEATAVRHREATGS